MYMTEIEDIEKGLIVTFTGGEVQRKDDIGEEFGHYVTAMAYAKWKANTAMPMCYPGHFPDRENDRQRQSGRYTFRIEAYDTPRMTSGAEDGVGYVISQIPLAAGSQGEGMDLRIQTCKNILESLLSHWLKSSRA